MPHSRKCNMGTPIKADPPKARENTSARRQLCAASERDALRVAALVAVARVYGLVPRATKERQFGARCPACRGSVGGRHLVIGTTPTGAIFECARCGVFGSGVEELQRLAEGSFQRLLTPSRTAALARLDAIIATRGDMAREVCDRLAEAIASPPARIQAANDDWETGEGRA